MLLYLIAMFTAGLLGGVAFLIGYGVYTILQEYRRDRVPALVYHRFLPKAKVTQAKSSTTSRPLSVMTPPSPSRWPTWIARAIRRSR